jgi:hypothetical protein
VHEAAIKAAVESAMKVTDQEEKDSMRAIGAMSKEIGAKMDLLGRQLPSQVCVCVCVCVCEREWVC